MAQPKVCERCGRLAFDGEPVTISGAEYQELVTKAEAFDRRAGPKNYLRYSKSPIARDPELADFLIKASATMMLGEMQLAVVNKFGADRAPSISAIHRFVHRVARNTDIQRAP